MPNYLFLFDVDGTIAKSSKKIDDFVLNLLLKNKNENYYFGLVSGGKYNKIIDQIGKNFILDKNPLFDYVFCENGMIGYHKNSLILNKNLKEFYSDVQLKEILNFIKFETKDFIYDNEYQKFEIRNSLIYFSPVGIDSDDLTREKFINKDIKFKVRENIISILGKKLFEKYNFKITLGGELGFAIIPSNWDKSYFIRNQIIDFGKYNKVYFFGDRCNINGNDYEIYSHLLTTGYHVKNPEDTFNILKNIFKKN